MNETRCGIIAIVGAPNAGKSTLMNALVGAKVAIVSRKAQTTRTRTLGITVSGNAELVFVDTPGIFEPRRRLDRAMVAAAWSGAGDADMVLLIVDASRRQDEETARIITRLSNTGRTLILVLNKVDAVKREILLQKSADLNKQATFAATFMISALTGDGVDDLKSYLAQNVPPGPWLYPEDQLSDISERLLAAEITREKIYEQLHDELPYASTVETESWENRKDGSAKVSQVIFVEKDSQKAIVIGKGGARLKEIGQAARTELESLLGRKIHLFLFVKVRENWGDDRDRYRAIGLDYVD
jgi:GTP-binding protein Era